MTHFSVTDLTTYFVIQQCLSNWRRALTWVFSFAASVVSMYYDFRIRCEKAKQRFERIRSNEQLEQQLEVCRPTRSISCTASNECDPHQP